MRSCIMPLGAALIMAAGGGHGWSPSYSPDMEFLEIVSPAEFGTVEAEVPIPIPDTSGEWPDPQLRWD